MLGAAAGLLFRIEAKAYPAMLYLGMSDEIFHSCNDLSDARLVVSSEKRGSVGHDELVSQIVVKVGEIRNLYCHVGIELDVPTLVLQDPGLDVGSGNRG